MCHHQDMMTEEEGATHLQTYVPNQCWLCCNFKANDKPFHNEIKFNFEHNLKSFHRFGESFESSGDKK